MTITSRSNHLRPATLAFVLCGAVLAPRAPAAEVTPERLIHADREPQNWLMNHRAYNGQRFSPLDRIDKTNVKALKLAYAVALGGGSPEEYGEATPLVEDGFLYLTDSWSVLYKIDVTAGDVGRIIWRMDPKQLKHEGANRGAALWGNLVISVANRPARVIATDKDTGKVVWETNVNNDQPELLLSGAPLAIKDKIIFGAAGGDRGVRDWIAALDAATGKLLWRKYTIPAPGEPGSETWKGTNNAWQTGGAGVWVTGTYDPDSNQTIWGTGNPVPMFDPFYRPGDNLYTNSAISWNPDTGNMNWYFQFTPGDMWDYDEVGTHILIDGMVAGEPRKLITHSGRNGILYTMERANGQIVVAKPYMEVNWTKGIDQKTGKPVDYDSNRDIQIYSGVANQNPNETGKTACPSHVGGNNYWPSSYSPRTKLLYIAEQTGCDNMLLDMAKHSKERGWNGGGYWTNNRYESDLTAIDPLTGEIRKSVHQRYPNYGGTLVTGGGLVFTGLTDGTFAAFDDSTLDVLWKINVGSGFSAPPMTFAVNGKQYIAIVAGPSAQATKQLVNTQELKEQRKSLMLYVFAL
jgi:alcohol dehydrogenase (cytochrome c)